MNTRSVLFAFLSLTCAYVPSATFAAELLETDAIPNHCRKNLPASDCILNLVISKNTPIQTSIFRDESFEYDFWSKGGHLSFYKNALSNSRSLPVRAHAGKEELMCEINLFGGVLGGYKNDGTENLSEAYENIENGLYNDIELIAGNTEAAEVHFTESFNFKVMEKLWEWETKAKISLNGQPDDRSLISSIEITLLQSGAYEAYRPLNYGDFKTCLSHLGLTLSKEAK